MPTASSVAQLRLEKSTSNSFSIHWSAVIAGIFIASIAYMILGSLGVAVGATQLQHSFSLGDSTLKGTSEGLGAFLFTSILIALFIGAYASGRVSGFVATRVGYIQGAVISAAFFAIMLLQAGAAAGFIGAGLGGLKDVISASAQSLGSNAHLTETIEDSLSGIQLKSDAKTVASGLVSRLMNEDSKSAVIYIADQTGLSREEALAKYQTINQSVRDLANRIGQKTSEVARNIAWFSSALMFFGTLFAMFGGALGAQFSMRKPVDNLDRSALRSMEHEAYV
jgi:hypothetical protein